MIFMTVITAISNEIAAFTFLQFVSSTPAILHSRHSTSSCRHCSFPLLRSSYKAPNMLLFTACYKKRRCCRCKRRDAADRKKTASVKVANCLQMNSICCTTIRHPRLQFYAISAEGFDLYVSRHFWREKDKDCRSPLFFGRWRGQHNFTTMASANDSSKRRRLLVIKVGGEIAFKK